MALYSPKTEKIPAPSEHSGVVVITIPSGRKYSIHSHLLAHHSEYFRQLLNGIFEGVIEHTLSSYSQATEEGIEAFMKWIYERSSTCQTDIKNEEYLWYDHHMDGELLSKSWLFSEYIGALGFREEIIQALDDGHPLDLDTIREVWSLIPSESLLLPIMFDRLCWLERNESLDDTRADLVDFPPDLALEVLECFPFDTEAEFNLQDYLED
ncbi:hypothetical protein F4677DRAFT_160428 [Hypoxylon crocopeplum]|nr:hypothetical protein F4677DRAFT_160428 [Hypoxylon crocopeplum]